MLHKIRQHFQNAAPNTLKQKMLNKLVQHYEMLHELGQHHEMLHEFSIMKCCMNWGSII